jgi:outer membrane autotransporter protein
MRECIGAATISQRLGSHRTRRSLSRTRARWHRLLLICLPVAALAALLPRSAAAQTWIGATSNDWTVGSNWNGGTVPAGGAVNINSTNPAVLGVNGPASGSTANFIMGVSGGTVSLTIQNGSTLTSNSPSDSYSIGTYANGTAIVTVTGAGSLWNTVVGQIILGNGTSILNIKDGGTVDTQALRLGPTVGAGTLNMSGGGTLITSRLTIGTRSGANFDNAILRASGANAAWISGTGIFNIAAGGVTVDSAGFDVGSTMGFQGVGGLTKIGAGTLTLSVNNSYAGATAIQAGTLALTGTGAINSSSRVVDNATFDISGLTGAGTSIQSLAGNGAVALGAKTLTITNASDTFAGVIGGTGGVQVTGGTQALSGVNTYSGVTTITNGTLALTGAGAISNSSRVVDNAAFDISGLTGGGASVQTLAGNGAVALGANTLTITHANDTFAGVIGGSGGLTIAGGTEALSGVNTYGGVTTITSGTLALTGAGSISNSGRVADSATFDISGLTGTSTNIQSLAGNGTVALGAKTLTITNANDTFAGAVNGSGGLTVTGGTQTLSGVNSYGGATTVSGGTLRAGAAGVFSTASAFVTGVGGTLDLNGFNQTIAALDNAGTIRFGTAPGTTLTVAGNYAGSGGTLLFNTVLGGDHSATDRLVVQGNTSGTSTVRIDNVGGTGAPTVNGVKLIDVAGASNGNFTLSGDFALQGQQVVVGGAYAYTLQKNGVSTPTDGDWYLRSSLINPPPAAPAGPLYQPGVPLYENYAQVLLGMNAMPSLQERVGNRYWGGGEAMARAGVNTGAQTDGSWTQSAFWGRIDGGQVNMQPSNTTGSTYNADQFKAQAGLDGLALENDRGRLIVGLTAQYGLTTAYVNSFYGNGRIRAEGSGIGATATWYGDNGVYVDGQAQTMFYHSDLSSDIAGSMTHGNEGLGYAFSAEGGRRFGIGNGFWLTPQAQLSYSKVDFDAFSDRFGALVSLANADSLLGRVGLSLNHQKTWNDGSGIIRSDIYAIANLHYEFLDGTNVDVSGTGFASANDRLWGSIGGGGSYSWANGRYTLFGEATYSTSLEYAAENHSYKGTGGFRIVW